MCWRSRWRWRHPPPRQKTADEDEAIRDVVRATLAARERGDATELAALFTADADQLTSSGEWRRGRAELVPGTLASSKNNTGARTITIKTVRFPAPDVAIADGEYVIARQSGHRRPEHVDIVRDDSQRAGSGASARSATCSRPHQRPEVEAQRLYNSAAGGGVGRRIVWVLIVATVLASGLGAWVTLRARAEAPWRPAASTVSRSESRAPGRRLIPRRRAPARSRRATCSSPNCSR